MPSRWAHETFGIIIGVASAYISCKIGKVNPEITHHAVGIISASFGALLPDWLEPPFSRWHRGFFHSVTLLTALLIFTAIFIVHNPDLWTRLVLLALSSGYISHLGLDFLTPKRLPLIIKGL